LNALLALIEGEIVRHPTVARNIQLWASFANMAKNPDPRAVLDKISFPPGSKTIPRLSQLAIPLFSRGKFSEGFKFLKELEEWMDAQASEKGDMFNDAFLDVAVEKTKYLILDERISEIKSYVEGIRYKLASNWPKFVEQIKNPNIRSTGMTRIPSQENITKIGDYFKELFELPAMPATEADGEKRFDGILVLHNFSQHSFDKLHANLVSGKVNFYTRQDASLAKNSWALKNMNNLVASGAVAPTEDDASDEIKELMGIIHNEERKNLNRLALFIRQNPDNYDAMDMYCMEAAKFLPDEAIENMLYAYSAKTCTPPTLEAYSKFSDKEKWSKLASSMVIKGLVKLKDSPSFLSSSATGATNNPLANLNNWESLDKNNYAIDWYGFFKTPEGFWYMPMYYIQNHFMPEPIFVKYLVGAEKAGDWGNILKACEIRFDSDKTKCRNEQILEYWNKSQERLDSSN
jgi:hypothetical protein